ncbi:MAG: type II toxin-antitoxin system RelE/ParE family toxin [Ignavibacteriae bacterium]|nr:type II toxin-antitoxin system RelE/ParE family toxin [Ignavibacteriota bacterium]
MQIEVSTKAQKFLVSQTIDSQNKIKQKISSLKLYLEENNKIPFNNMDIKVLKGKWYPFKRLRTGKIRVIFEVDFKLKKLYIEELDNRGDIY